MRTVEAVSTPLSSHVGIKRLHSVHNSMGDTAVHTDSGPRSRKTKCHNSKQLGGSVNCFKIMVLSSNCDIDHK